MTKERLEYLKDRLKFILKFMEENSIRDKALIDEYIRLQSVVDEAFNKGRLSKLERYNKDFNDLVRNIPELKKAVDVRFNEDSDNETKKILAKVRRESFISNREEWEIVKEKVNDLCKTESDESEIEFWNKILLKFETNVP
jgi:hypothetical protein